MNKTTKAMKTLAALSLAPTTLAAAQVDAAAGMYAALRSIGYTHARALRESVDTLKESVGCAACGYDLFACGLDFDHCDPADKYRTASGVLVAPADLVKGGRYSAATCFAEIRKCRVLCGTCHKVYTHKVQRA